MPGKTRQVFLVVSRWWFFNDEFTTWVRGQVKDLTGVDLSAPPEGPPPDLLVDCAP